MSETSPPIPWLDRVQRIVWMIAAVGVLACAIGWISQPATFYRAYLFAWLPLLGVALGSMAVVMMHHLTGGDWGWPIRRFGEVAAMTLPLVAVLFIPVIIGAPHLFPWAEARERYAEPVLAHRAGYMNLSAFIARAVIYFALWIAMAAWLYRGSLRLDRESDPGLARRLLRLSAGGLVVLFLSMSLASVDWIMSREVQWYSTVLGFIVVCGQGVTALSFLILLLAVFVWESPHRLSATADQFNDLGNLLLTFVVVWTYMSFVQLLVIWMGNVQEEVPYYVQRLSGGWWWIGMALVVLHFAVPFIILLMRQAKRKVPIMLWLCAGLLVMRYLDVYWIVAPSGDDPHPALRHVLSWMDFALPIGLAGLWLAAFLWLLKRQPLVARRTEEGPLPEAYGAH